MMTDDNNTLDWEAWFEQATCDEVTLITMFNRDKHLFLDNAHMGDVDRITILFEQCFKHNWLSAAETVLTWSNQLNNRTTIWDFGLFEARTIEMAELFLKHFPLPSDHKNNWTWTKRISGMRECFFLEVLVDYALNHEQFPVTMFDWAYYTIAMGRVDNLSILVGYLDDNELCSLLIEATSRNERKMIDFLYTPERAIRTMGSNQMKEVSMHSSIGIDTKKGLEYLQQKIDSDQMREILRQQIDMTRDGQGRKRI